MKHRLEKQQQALAKKQAEMEALKAEVDPAERVKDLMTELRKTEPLCRDSNRSQVQFKPKWGSTASVRKWIREAVGKDKNKSFKDLCSEVANKGVTFAKKNGWTGKISFVCAIIPQDSY